MGTHRVRLRCAPIPGLLARFTEQFPSLGNVKPDGQRFSPADTVESLGRVLDHLVLRLGARTKLRIGNGELPAVLFALLEKPFQLRRLRVKGLNYLAVEEEGVV